jgi:lipopolysaccharide export system protein LptA
MRFLALLFAALLLFAASDAAIEKNLRARLARSKIAANKFTFTVKDGVVTLSGKTKVPQHKGTATRLAKAAGAVRVVNQISLESPPSTAQTKTSPPPQAAKKFEVTFPRR